MLTDVISDRRPTPAPNRPRSRPLVSVTAVLGVLLAAAVAAIVVLASARHGTPSRALLPGTAGGTRGLDVLPFPGTPDASPQSQIIFPALLPPEIKSVAVRGSHSGIHHGRLEALPGGRGTAFVPRNRFSDGERVWVRARLSSRAAGTASGAPNKSRLRFSFTIATPAVVEPGKAPSAASSTPPANVQPLSFHSTPGLHPPPVKFSGQPSPGKVLVTAQDSTQQGPMILDRQGHLVWFRPISQKRISAFGLSVQHYQGKPVLAWWQGRVTSGGYGIDGEDVILNQRYRTVAVLHAGYGYSPDLHDVKLTPQGTALVTAFVPVEADLSSVGGPKDGTVLDGVVQEVDVKTRRVVWTWHALGHVPISASESGKANPGEAYDYFHVNSVQQLPDGNLLISARNTWAVYEISRITGKVIWTLGGKDSDFQMGSGTSFEWQHDARMQPDGTLTVFDDANTPEEEVQSRALRLDVDASRMRVTLRHAYAHSPKELPSAMGSMQLLRDGNVFVGWGTEPNFSEYTPSGRQVFDGSFHAPVQSYRAYLERWTAQPTSPPGISVAPRGSADVTVYASWNGATEVTGWRLLAGASPHSLKFVETTSRTGFETAIKTHASNYFEVQALAGSGKVLGTSKVISR